MSTTTLPTLSLVLAALTFSSAAAQQEIELPPSKDNTLYQSSTGSASNGAGGTLYFGLTNQSLIRRALIAFDVGASVPSGATIDSVKLHINVTKTIVGPTNVAVHRVQQDWGEGTSVGTGAGANSTVGDATWIHAIFETSTWQAAGGDYDPAIVTSTVAGGGGLVEFPSTPELVSMVQSWLDTPDQNFGLILIGDENTSPSAKQIGSREGSEANAPKLVIRYAIPTGTASDELPGFLTSLSTYPNPANETATIRYELRESREVRIDVLDVTGRLVSTPVFGARPAGGHAVRIDATGLTPGLYLVRLVSGGQSASQSLILQ